MLMLEKNSLDQKRNPDTKANVVTTRALRASSRTGRVSRNREFLTLREYASARFWQHRAVNMAVGRNVRHALPSGSKVAPVVDHSDVGVPAAIRIRFVRHYLKDETDRLARNASP
jgi:hypothetical protein